MAKSSGKKTLAIALVALFVVAIAIALFYMSGVDDQTSSGISKSAAIELVKTNFPELKDYPSTNFPLKAIAAEKDTSGWRISFILEGSGRPVLAARCFLVSNPGGYLSVTVLGGFSSVSSGYEEQSLAACKSGCMMQGCHGLDVTCGEKAPPMCTEIYMLGDRCRNLAKCEIVDGNCVLSAGEQFSRCKACSEKCNADNALDSMKAFDCESRCG
jgi:hypothetical protein